MAASFEADIFLSYQVLARKWRPRDFSQVVGQTHVVRALANGLDRDRLHHAFLFTGTRGVGKTTLARILAKCLNCESGVTSSPCGTCSSCTEIDEGRFVDLIEVDAASRSKVDETRELMENVHFSTARGRYKVYLIDEVHMFSEKSFNALLKTLEEPPPHVKFLLATTEPQKLPITVLSRCLHFSLKRLPAGEIATHLAVILEREGIASETTALHLIARAADGSMRDAQSLLDQAISYGSGRVAHAEVCAMLGTLDRGHLHALLQSIAGGDPEALLRQVEEMAGDAVDFDDALAELLSALQRIATLQAVPGAARAGPEAEDEAHLLDLAARIAKEDIQLYYQIAALGRRDLPLSPDPRGGFEMTLLRMLAFRPVPLAPEGRAAEDAAAKGAASAPSAPPRVTPRARPAGAASPPPDPAAITSETWIDLVEELGVTGMVRQLAANCEPVGHAEGRLKLHLAPRHEQLNASRAREQLERALEKRLGVPLALDIELALPREDTPARREERNDAERRQAAVAAIENDSTVRAICETFGTEVDPRLVTPVD